MLPLEQYQNEKTMADSSIMLDLCKELKISANELLSGKMIDMIRDIKLMPEKYQK